MPFPKGARKAADVAQELRGLPLEQFEGVDLMLISAETFETDKFGQGIVLVCKDENDNDVRMSTFSEVVIDQVGRVKDHLPLIIKPHNNGTYYTVY